MTSFKEFNGGMADLSLWLSASYRLTSTLSSFLLFLFLTLCDLLMWCHMHKTKDITQYGAPVLRDERRMGGQSPMSNPRSEMSSSKQGCLVCPLRENSVAVKG